MPNADIPTGGCYAWRQNDRVPELGNTSSCLPAVGVNVKEYIDLITQKLAKYALHISPPSLCNLRAHTQHPRLRCYHCLFVFDRQLIMTS